MKYLVFRKKSYLCKIFLIKQKMYFIMPIAYNRVTFVTPTERYPVGEACFSFVGMKLLPQITIFIILLILNSFNSHIY